MGRSAVRAQGDEEDEVPGTRKYGPCIAVLGARHLIVTLPALNAFILRKTIDLKIVKIKQLVRVPRL